MRTLPKQEQRVESGPIRFGDDWPGLFLRGDTCFGYLGTLGRAIMELRVASDPVSKICSMHLTGLFNMLVSVIDAPAEVRRPIPEDFARYGADPNA